jgi:hypothetical protein
MRLPDDVEELRLIAEHHTACRTLRRMGWACVMFGVINMGIALMFTVQLHPINAALALIGLFLLAAGVWCLVLPGAEGVLANGIALILVGLWNILITVLNAVAGEPPRIWWALFGAIQIAAAVQGFQKYSRFSRALRYRVSRDELAMMDTLVKTILKANSKEDEAIIGFQVRGYTQEKVWRGQLGQDAAIFVEKTSNETLVCDRTEVSIKPQGAVLFGNSLKARVRIGDQTWEATISPQSFDRFRDWKFREEEEGANRRDEAGEDEHEPQTGIRSQDDLAEEPPTGIKKRKEESEPGAT